MLARKQAQTFAEGVMFTLLTLLLISSFDVMHVGVTHAPPSITSRAAATTMAREEGGGELEREREGEREEEREGGWDPLDPPAGGSFSSCKLRTRVGLCMAELFRLYNKAYTLAGSWVGGWVAGIPNLEEGEDGGWLAGWHAANMAA